MVDRNRLTNLLNIYSDTIILTYHAHFLLFHQDLFRVFSTQNFHIKITLLDLLCVNLPTGEYQTNLQYVVATDIY